jgi:hypothetical protein
VQRLVGFVSEGAAGALSIVRAEDVRRLGLEVEGSRDQAQEHAPEQVQKCDGPGARRKDPLSA